MLAFAENGGTLAVILIVLCLFLDDIGSAVSSVLSATVRQKIVPDRALARSMASNLTLAYGLIPLGSLIVGDRW